MNRFRLTSGERCYKESRTPQQNPPHSIDDAETQTDELTIGELPLNERQSMQFHNTINGGKRWMVTELRCRRNT